LAEAEAEAETQDDEVVDDNILHQQLIIEYEATL